MLVAIIIRWLVQNFPGIDIGFLVHRRELHAQTVRAFGEIIGKDRIDITAGRRSTHKPRGCVRVYMEQTMATRFADVPDHPIDKHDVLFVDEAHSMNYQSFLGKFLSQGTAVIGLTATPDDWRLLKFFEQEKIVGPSQADLEKLGVLVEPTFYTSAAIDKMTAEQARASADAGKKKSLHFQNALAHIVPEMQRAEKDAGTPLRWMIKTQKKHQAIDLAEHLVKHGIPARPFYAGSGGGVKQEMDAILDGNSPHRVAVVVQRFAVGYDHPGIQGIVLTGSMLYSLFVQTVGRALRPGFPRVKDTAYVVDLAGNLVQYRSQYIRRRTQPVPRLPDPPEPKLAGGVPRPKNERLFEEEKIELHRVVLSHFDKRSSDLPDSELIAYCAVKADIDVGGGEKYNTARARRTAQMFWILTGRRYSRETMAEMVGSNPAAFLLWKHRAAMPPSLAEELAIKNFEYSKQKRREYAMRNFA